MVAMKYRAFVKKEKVKFDARDLIPSKEQILAQCQDNVMLLEEMMRGEIPSVEDELKACRMA